MRQRNWGREEKIKKEREVKKQEEIEREGVRQRERTVWDGERRERLFSCHFPWEKQREGKERVRLWKQREEKREGETEKGYFLIIFFDIWLYNHTEWESVKQWEEREGKIERERERGGGQKQSLLSYKEKKWKGREKKEKEKGQKQDLFSYHFLWYNLAALSI